MSEDETAEPAADADAESTTTVEDSNEESASEEPETPPLDPEIVALKESITSLESDLKAKKSQLSSLKDMVEKYSSTGYARQVALVENNKRLRGASNTDTRGAARAEVMRSFLPVMDALDAAGVKYEGNQFAKTFDAGLRSEFENALSELGVAEFSAESGATIELGRMVAVEEEVSTEFKKGTVIRAVKPGLEISGNVVRPAEVVGSLGEEQEEVAAEEEEGGDAE